MKRLLIAIVLMWIVYQIFSVLQSEIQTYTQRASLILSGTTQEELHDTIVAEYKNTHHVFLSEPIEIDVQYVYLNTDTDIDIIATAKNSPACGSGGCIPILLVQENYGGMSTVNFSYAVKSIEVSPTITNSMHNLIINKGKKQMVWNGEAYEPE